MVAMRRQWCRYWILPVVTLWVATIVVPVLCDGWEEHVEAGELAESEELHAKEALNHLNSQDQHHAQDVDMPSPPLSPPLVGSALHLALPRDPREEDTLEVQHRAMMIANKHQRIAHACSSDEDCSEYHHDFLEKSSEDDNTNMFDLSEDYVHSFCGMKLHVFQRQQSEPTQHATTTSHHSETIPRGGTLSSQATKSQEQDNLHKHQRSADPFLFHRAYQLVEPMHLQLGVIPRHYLDFAYTPVHQDQRKTSPRPSMSTSSVSEQRDASLKDSHLTSEDAQSTKGESREHTTCLVNVEDETCKAVIMEDEDDAKFSWWTWWFTFTNPWWKTGGGSSQSNYTMGKSAFAGGSHGQVWRGRRRCPSLEARQSVHTIMHAKDPSGEDEKSCDEDQPLIMKRLKVEVEGGYRFLEAGLREVYFGRWIQGLPQEEQGLFTTYEDHFFREIPPSGSHQNQDKDLELWIVFQDAGKSLRRYMYAPISTAGGFVLYQHSNLWAQLRMTSRDTSHSDDHMTDLRNDLSEQPNQVSSYREEGENVSNHSDSSERGDQHPRSKKIPNIGRMILSTVLQQILSAAAILHDGGIVHRDIKPSNVMCTSDIELDDLYAMEQLPIIRCRLGDFSSGWDRHTADNLYTRGPSPGEQTNEYAPPESYLGPNWVPFHGGRPQSYDSWSIGVLALELLLGTPNVFSVDQRTTALLTNKMKKEGATDEELQRALYLAALSQFCIYVPNSTLQQSWPLRHGDPLHKTAMVKESCTLQDFHRALRARDPLGIGFDSSTDMLLHLLWQLLAWDPMERMTAKEALQHPFFVNPEGTRESLTLVPSRDNALESQMLDPRLDFTVEDSVREFVCPKCGRTFSDWHSCHIHATSRRHAKFCNYDRRSLPSCINTHSMLPSHPTSGYCDLQGRRRVIEDFHSIHLHPTVQFYGMFDGHTGNVASKYVASTLYEQLLRRLPGIQEESFQSADGWKAEVQRNISEAFNEIHGGFLDAVSMAPNMDQSGTTATALLVTNEAVILSSLGDSRAVLSSVNADGSLSAMQLTKDHVASDPTEQKLVVERGGSISSSGGIDRVNGTLAITRSIGDANLASVLSREPHVISMTRSEVRTYCGEHIPGNYKDLPCFVVLASDGLWDVMSNREAVEMVAEVMMSYDSTDRVSWNNGGAFQEAAEMLAVDAYVRGSTDNIGVCVVAVT